MKKIVEVYRSSRDCKKWLEDYRKKGLKIDKEAMKATSNYLDITIIEGGRGLEERLQGLEIDIIEFDHMPQYNVIKYAVKTAKEDVVIMGVVYE